MLKYVNRVSAVGIFTYDYQILRAQMGAVLREVSKEGKIEFVFLQGEIDSEPHPAIADVYEGPFFNWFPWPPKLGQEHYKQSLQDAYDLIYEFIDEEGPFDGIIGFSQGATLAYMSLLNHAKLNPYGVPLFSRAIFICGMPPFRLTDDSEILLETDIQTLDIPAVHVMGAQDEVLDLSMALAKLTNPALSLNIVHTKGHDIPKSKDFTSQLVKGMEQLDRAANACGM
jgi:predicted esterase